MGRREVHRLEPGGGALAAPTPAAMLITPRRGRIPGKIPADRTGRTLEITKDPERQEGSPSQSFKKSTEADAKVHDLNQRTMQALKNPALENAAFGQAGTNMEVE